MDSNEVVNAFQNDSLGSDADFFKNFPDIVHFFINFLMLL